MNVKIHEPHGSNRYCGPAIMSMLTGKSADSNGPIVKEMRNITGQRAIRSYSATNLFEMLKRHGFQPKVTYKSIQKQGLTLNQWLNSDGKDRIGRTFVILAFHHFFIVQGNKYFDRPYGFNVDVRKAPRVKRRGRMVYAFEVNPDPVPTWSELLDLLPS